MAVEGSGVRQDRAINISSSTDNRLGRLTGIYRQCFQPSTLVVETDNNRRNWNQSRTIFLLKHWSLALILHLRATYHHELLVLTLWAASL